MPASATKYINGYISGLWNVDKGALSEPQKKIDEQPTSR